METAPFSVGECFSFGFEIWKKKLAEYVLATFVLMLANVAVSVVLTVVHFPVPFVANLLVSGLISGGLMNAALRGARGETVGVGDVFVPWKERQGDYLIVGVASGILLFVTSFLFMFAPLLVVQGADYKTALGESYKLVTGRLSDAIVLGLALFFVNLAGAIPCGLGLFVTIPVSALAVVRAHALLTGAAPAQPVGSLP